MKNLFLLRQVKIVVDVLMFLAFIFALVYFVFYEAANIFWKSSHCIFGIILVLLMLVHIAQNWKFTKALFKKKVMWRNKITALTTFVFISVFISVVLFAFGVFSIANLKLHHSIGSWFALLIFIHIIQKFKCFLSMNIYN
ncbi:MAG: hypothetical protein LBG80_08135 [Bacteroidales bacterium]|jgi:hypothetical protein|nr:hypothetical protein [Bacteroidales bacterium]